MTEPLIIEIMIHKHLKGLERMEVTTTYHHGDLQDPI